MSEQGHDIAGEQGEPLETGEQVFDEDEQVEQGGEQYEGGIRPALTLSDAARETRASRETLRRRLDAGKFPNAWREFGDTGPWYIPVVDLIGAGFSMNAVANRDAPVVEQPSEQGHDVPSNTPAPTAIELMQARLERDMALRDSEKWQAVASERERTIGVYERQLPAAASDVPPGRLIVEGVGEPPTANLENGGARFPVLVVTLTAFVLSFVAILLVLLQ